MQQDESYLRIPKRSTRRSRTPRSDAVLARVQRRAALAFLGSDLAALSRAAWGRGLRGAPAAAALPALPDWPAVYEVGRVVQLPAADLYRLAGWLLRRHRAGVASGVQLQRWRARQSALARRRSVPRLRACLSRDAALVALRRAGLSWRAVAAALGVPVRTARGAYDRLRRLALREAA